MIDLVARQFIPKIFCVLNFLFCLFIDTSQTIKLFAQKFHIALIRMVMAFLAALIALAQ
ncbi:hypothetical protein [Sodalis endosymbiont of Henestaris halophilus]|uniref:hypothetical protein n=1 Tax=Sodalis endosymbiont of Henestaris halophilus TaxID=1929246 RepID=UPI0012FE3FAD|nr:hypothetical protein [Sodalis endosymbiont of Henestaris halophilus]